MNTLIITAMLISNPQFEDTVKTVEDVQAPREEHSLADCMLQREKQGHKIEDAFKICNEEE